MELNELERDVLEWFASHNNSEALRQQCAAATIVRREYTGPGLVVELQSPTSCAPAEFGCTPNAPLISSQLLPHGASVDLWISSGRISNLEFVTLGGQLFPAHPFPYKLVDSL